MWTLSAAQAGVRPASLRRPAPPRPRPDSWLAADQQRGHARFGCALLLVLVPNLAPGRLETVDPDMSTRED